MNDEMSKFDYLYNTKKTVDANNFDESSSDEKEEDEETAA
jgi:hypothetical protein